MASFSFFLVSYWRCWCCNKKKSERKPSQILADGDGETAIERERERRWEWEKKGHFMLCSHYHVLRLSLPWIVCPEGMFLFFPFSRLRSPLYWTLLVFCARDYLSEKERARACVSTFIHFSWSLAICFYLHDQLVFFPFFFSPSPARLIVDTFCPNQHCLEGKSRNIDCPYSGRLAARTKTFFLWMNDTFSFV